MLRLVSLASLGLALVACTPEVELARHPTTIGGAPSAGGDSGESGDSGDGGAPTLPQPPRLLADSVADFSLTQGEHGWFYGSDGGDVADFQQLGRISVITNFVPPNKDVWDCFASETTHWTQIFRLGAHPNGTDTSPPSVALLERAVRRWVSDYEGDVVISGEAAKIDLIDSNGVRVLIYVDGAQLFTADIAGDDGAGLAYDVPAFVRVGSTVDFVLDPLNGHDRHDLSRFTGVIMRAP